VRGAIAGGTAIRITGTNFLAGPTVTIDGIAATSVVWESSTSISAVTPAGTIGSKNIVITNTDLGAVTSVGSFTYITPPTFTSISPSRGETTTGTAITITGSNFLAGPTVTIGGTAATSIVRVSATTITALAPAGTLGLKSIIITNTDAGTITIPNAYNYGPLAAISIAAIPGVTVPVTGATPVTTITATAQYTGTITWSGTPTTFPPGTIETATITLTPLTGYTLTGVGANFFTVETSTATNALDSGVITAVFAATSGFTVTYNSQGGSAITSGFTSTGGSISVSPGSPTQSGFTFNGWFAAASGGSAIVFPYLHGQVANFTLFAQWTAVVVSGGGGGGGGGGSTTTTTPTPTVVVTPVVEVVVTPTPAPVAPVVVVPTPVVISPAKPLVVPVLSNEAVTLFVGVAGSDGVVVPITIDIPIGITGVDGQVRLTPVLLTGNNPLGLVTIQIEILDAFGGVIPQINANIVIHFDNPAGGTTVASSQDGFIWTPIPLIPDGGKSLPAGFTDGYYLDANGKVVIVTSHLTFFGFKVSQAAKLEAKASSKVFVKTNTTEVAISGGSGDGVLKYDSLTTAICKVSPTGLVTFKSAGICKITATKGGDATYLHQITSYQMNVVNYSLKAVGTGVSKQVTLILGASYAKKTVVLQYKLKGSTRYVAMTSGVLSSTGQVATKKNVPTGSTLRALVAGKVVASIVVTGKN
jgi:uncharacterized repeat protein (TIGR02543 family)